MKELIVGGESGTHYIVEVNGEKKTVRSGDVVRFNKKEDADKALENVTIMGGGLLFREKFKQDNEATEINTTAISVAIPRDEAESGILDTGDTIIDTKKVQKRELKKDAKNNKNS